MDRDPILQLIAGEYPDPDGGGNLDVRVKSVVIAESLRDREVELVRGLVRTLEHEHQHEIGAGERLAVVSDDNTHRVLGARVEAALASAFSVQRLHLGASPHADQDTLERLEAAIEPDIDMIIAVGSGTINDLCKLAAARRGRPYAVFGTAPSMNGYASVSASISIDGLKRSLPAQAPAGVFLDLDVLAHAPLRLIHGGLGECLCRPTAQSDWLLAHLLRGEPYREAPFALLAAEEDELFASSDALVAGDLSVMNRLARTLVLSGFGMTICGGSYPASQGEHLISHYLEMTRTAGEPECYHGEQIGLATLTMADLQERILAMPEPPRAQPSQVSKQSLCARLGHDLGERCWRELEAKLLDRAGADALSEQLRESWDELRERISAVARPAGMLRATLERAGAPASPQALGWSSERYAEACTHAREVRSRFTFLDLAAACEIPIYRG